MIQPNKINIWIAPPAEGKTYKTVQYCLEQQHNTKFIFASCYKYQINNDRRYICRLFDAAKLVTVTDAVSVLTGSVDTFNANVIFDDANKNIITIPLIDGRTVAHEAIGEAGAARVIIKPAAAGTGVIAGGSVRAILELAGIRDVVSKSLGARTKLNMATAALNALKSIKTPEQVAALRGKSVEEILG